MPHGCPPGQGRARVAAAAAAAAASKHRAMLERIAEGRKWCPPCAEWHPIGEFSPQPSAPDGHHGYCRSAMAAYARRRRAERQQATQLAAAAAGCPPGYAELAAAADRDPAWRAVCVAVRWRLAVSNEDAAKVAALLLEHPGRADLPERVAWLPDGAMTALAREAGVQPGSDPPEVIARPHIAEWLGDADRRDRRRDATRTQPGAA
jgi:hypothetical protein